MVIEGQSIYVLRGKVLNKSEQIAMFPHFAVNTKDPSYVFTDAAVHQRCLNEYENRGKKDTYCFYKFSNIIYDVCHLCILL